VGYAGRKAHWPNAHWGGSYRGLGGAHYVTFRKGKLTSRVVWYSPGRCYLHFSLLTTFF
jgi:hypothetical protein